MIAAYFVAVRLFIILFFAFFHYSPKGRQGVTAYSVGVLVLTVSLCARYTMKLHGEMEGSANYDLFFTIAPLAALGIVIAVLIAGGLMRNYVVFRWRT